MAPVLESYGVSPGNKHAMKASTGYDAIQGLVMEGRDRVMNDVNNVKSRLAEQSARYDFT